MKSTTSVNGTAAVGGQGLEARIETRIRALQRSVGHSLWGTAIFLAVSGLAYQGFALFPDMPEGWRETLGAPPPVDLISLALVIYAFSGIILVFARMTRNSGSGRGFQHAGFLLGFYLFYHLAGGLADNFWAVFFSGCSVLGLENYSLWTRSGAAIRKQKACLAELRAGRRVIIEDDDEEEGE